MSDITQGWLTPDGDDRLSMVFKNRWQKYGAYLVRKNYVKNKTIATIISCSLFSLILISAYTLFTDHKSPKKKKGLDVKQKKELFKNQEKKKEEEKKIEVVKKKVEPPKYKLNFKVNDRAIVEELPKPPDRNIIQGGTNQNGNIDSIPYLGGNDGSGNGNNNSGYTAPLENPTSAPYYLNGGDEGFYKFLGGYLEGQYPPDCLAKNIEHKLILRFVVSKKGFISDIVVINPHPQCPEFNQLAKNALLNSGKWKAGRNEKGVDVASKRNITVNFTLSSE